MKRQEAYDAMLDDKVIRHRFFDEGEYIYMKGNFIFTEEGYNMWSEFDEFWSSKKTNGWEDGWSICEGIVIEPSINDVLFN